MTTKETQAWKTQLTQVWEPDKVERFEVDEDGVFLWEARLSRSLVLYVNADSTNSPYIALNCFRREVFVASLGLNEGSIEEFQERTHKRNVVLYEFGRRFLLQWRPLFRRNCWLSGADIEASAHEKAEWLRGFSREEVEGWELHF